MNRHRSPSKQMEYPRPESEITAVCTTTAVHTPGATHTNYAHAKQSEPRQPSGCTVNSLQQMQPAGYTAAKSDPRQSSEYTATRLDPTQSSGYTATRSDPTQSSGYGGDRSEQPSTHASGRSQPRQSSEYSMEYPRQDYKSTDVSQTNCLKQMLGSTEIHMRNPAGFVRNENLLRQDDRCETGNRCPDKSVVSGSYLGADANSNFDSKTARYSQVVRQISKRRNENASEDWNSRSLYDVPVSLTLGQDHADYQEKIQMVDELDIKIPKTVQNRLKELISYHPDGIWCAQLPDVYR